MSDVRDQGRALGDRTRYAIFEALRGAPGPVTVADLAAQFSLHPNAIRLHLGKLRDASLVIEEAAAPRGRGRPALLYRVSPGAVERWESASPHEELSLMLLEMLEDGRSSRDVGRSAGARLASSLGPSAQADPVDLLVGVTRRLGFEPQAPQLATGSGGDDEIVLGRCPFAVGAERAPQIVCDLHRGLAEGVWADSELEVTELVVRNPHQAGCRLRYRAANSSES